MNVQQYEPPGEDVHVFVQHAAGLPSEHVPPAGVQPGQAFVNVPAVHTPLTQHVPAAHLLLMLPPQAKQALIPLPPWVHTGGADMQFPPEHAKGDGQFVELQAAVAQLPCAYALVMAPAAITPNTLRNWRSAARREVALAAILEI